MVKALWIFPGQGGQRAGMLTHVPGPLRQHVEQLLGLKLLDTAQGYQDSVQLQVSITLLQVNQVDQLIAAGERPSLVAGHSLGVFTAAYAVGSLTRDDCFRLVKRRAELMQTAYPHGYGMGVIVGLTRTAVTTLVEQVHTATHPVYVSNQNASDQTAIAGELIAIDQVLTLAKQAGAAKALRLKVPVPSHSPLMAAVAEQLASAAQATPIQRPTGVYLANYSGHAARQAAKVRQDLVSNLVHPVYFEAMCQVALNYQPDAILNFAPGSPFRHVLQQDFGDLRQIDLNQTSLDDAQYLLNKWKRGTN
ncbi:ACP S-malonyltransferase [Lactiplantibacillus pentosus]|uniref:ACP S-malonyltransferase n=1 Tax=Lactiplantibacillus pentosus TaxID=1589 RepID=UPI001CDAD17F|nr:acyltransferase domain-containing protein [Lactiplantibacillus pentosus]